MLPTRRPSGRDRSPERSLADEGPFDRFHWSWLVPIWFLCLGAVYILALPTLLTVDGWLRMIGGIVGITAFALLLLDRKYEFGPWASAMIGLFGVLPLAVMLLLTTNRMFGTVHEERHRIIGIERRAELSGLLLHLENGAYADFPRRMRLAPRDGEVWYASEIHYRIHDGSLGIPVLLEQELLPSADHTLLPEVPRARP